MLLHQHFIEVAKTFGGKLAIHDYTANRKLSYHRALIAALLLARRFRKLEKGNIGLMVPTSAGCILAKLGILMSGRTPVMINYSTGAEQNARYAQRKCDFRTIITSKALLEKLECPYVEGMLYLEDIMADITPLQKLRAAAFATLPPAVLKRLVHGGRQDDNAVILFTSGSEKDPKAVQLTHRNIGANIIACTNRFHFTQDEVFLSHPALLPRLRPYRQHVDPLLPRQHYSHLRQPTGL